MALNKLAQFPIKLIIGLINRHINKPFTAILFLSIASLIGLAQEMIQTNEIILNDAARKELEEWKAVNATNKPPDPGASIETISLWRMNRFPGLKILYFPTNPPPAFIDVPGKYWFQTNAWGGVISNGLPYNFIVVQTNYGPKTYPVFISPQTEDQIAAYRESQKAEDRKKGINQDIRAREEKLKAASKTFQKGLTTPQEVLNSLGQPYTLEVRKVVGLNQHAYVPIGMEEVAGNEPLCLMRYTPHELFSPHKPGRAYQTLELFFDENGKLGSMIWY